MTPIRPGVTLTDKGEVISSPAFIGKQHGDYPFQGHWREQTQKEHPELWQWIQNKKLKRVQTQAARKTTRNR